MQTLRLQGMGESRSSEVWEAFWIPTCPLSRVLDSLRAVGSHRSGYGDSEDALTLREFIPWLVFLC